MNHSTIQPGYKQANYLLLPILFLIAVLWYMQMLYIVALPVCTLWYFNRKAVRVVLAWTTALAGFIVLYWILKVTFITTANIEAPAHDFQVTSMQAKNIWQDGVLADVANMEDIGNPRIWVYTLANGFVKIIFCQVIFLLGLIINRTLFIRKPR